MADQQNTKWARIVARTWTDDAFKRKLLDDPVSVLTEAGFEIPKGAKISVKEGPHEWILPLPTKPAGLGAGAGAATEDDYFTAYSSSAVCCC